MQNLFNTFIAFVDALINWVNSLFINVLPHANEVGEAAGQTNSLLGFFDGLLPFIPCLIILYAIVKLASSGLQITAKVISVLIMLGLIYLILNNYVDIAGIVNAGMTGTLN